MSPSTISLITRAQEHGQRRALVTSDGAFTYEQLLQGATATAHTLLAGDNDLAERRIAFLVPPGLDYVRVQWGIWLAGGLAVPLCLVHPEPELAYVIDDAQVDTIVVHPDFVDRVKGIASERELRLLSTTELDSSTTQSALPDIDPARRAMMLYTSGSTGRPKGVVTTHHNIEAQITSLVEAWEWSADDCILHTLPLHHIHGVINVLGCSLWAGATCHMLPKFDAKQVWDYLAGGELTLYMAVPTIYAKLISAYDDASPEQQAKWSDGAANLRLMVSGSAALPVSVLEKWRGLTGHTLLERYGMTEIGMGISNPLKGERRPGHIGQPLPHVEARLADEQGGVIAQPTAETSGEIQIKGAVVFREYWNRPDATAEAFTDDGWFKTGDVAVLDDGYYRILGRSSVDIIKTGGYKVSALEIEEVLRTHPAIRDCAVVGVPDDEWGERVCLAAALTPGQSLDLAGLRSWGKQHLAAYKVPQSLKVLDDLPRNAMGKVTKPQVRELFQAVLEATAGRGEPQ
ncbi:acyl-CoA synthetase [Phycisphaerales bacterium AB-hyl4]|uniref:Acyl-CoA synthetase n=1 Tax=Natronomicrosphaera hydrolytica TaxID=3242702 RepID=A0ABV4U2Z0_9BACT